MEARGLALIKAFYSLHWYLYLYAEPKLAKLWPNSKMDYICMTEITYFFIYLYPNLGMSGAQGAVGCHLPVALPAVVIRDS